MYQPFQLQLPECFPDGSPAHPEIVANILFLQFLIRLIFSILKYLPEWNEKLWHLMNNDLLP